METYHKEMEELGPPWRGKSLQIFPYESCEECVLIDNISHMVWCQGQEHGSGGQEFLVLVPGLPLTHCTSLGQSLGLNFPFCKMRIFFSKAKCPMFIYIWNVFHTVMMDGVLNIRQQQDLSRNWTLTTVYHASIYIYTKEFLFLKKKKSPKHVQG